MEYYYRRSKPETTQVIRIIKDNDIYQVLVGERHYLIDSVRLVDGILYLNVDGQQKQVAVARQGRSVWVTLGGQTYQLQRVDRRSQIGERSGSRTASELEAMMPGVVQEILVAEGEAVTVGQPILVLEAMKMEQRLTSSGDGVVQAIHVQPGQLVRQGQILVSFGPSDE
jgi:3-methylcrotonyl-CoA carboxylase alpha subunit